MDNSNLIDTSESFWEKTYEQNIKKLIGVGYRYTADRQLAEDLAHDSFLKAYQKVSTYEGKGLFEAWLRRIVVNECLKYLREQRKQKYLTKDLQNEDIALEPNVDFIQNENADFSEKELLAAINKLPEHHKMVFNLYAIDRFTHAQIARELGISEGTSKSHLARARKKLKEILNQKQNKSALFLLFWDIDGLFRIRFDHFEIVNFKKNPSDLFTNQSTSIPSFKASMPMAVKYSGVLIAGTGMAALSLLFWTKSAPPEIDFVTGRKIISSDTATFSENRINIENSLVTQNADSMENLKKMGLIVAASASLATNSHAQTATTVSQAAPLKSELTGASSQYAQTATTVSQAAPLKSVVTRASSQSLVLNNADNTELKLNDISDVPEIPDFRTDISGTFYGEKLHWSSEDNQLYFEGKSVISFGENQNIVHGSATFLGKVYYLVMDGKPATLGAKINLTNKKYHLKYLTPKTAQVKYGDEGKNGVIEIFPAG